MTRVTPATMAEAIAVALAKTKGNVLVLLPDEYAMAQARDALDGFSGLNETVTGRRIQFQVAPFPTEGFGYVVALDELLLKPRVA